MCCASKIYFLCALTEGSPVFLRLCFFAGPCSFFCCFAFPFGFCAIYLPAMCSSASSSTSSCSVFFFWTVFFKCFLTFLWYFLQLEKRWNEICFSHSVRGLLSSLCMCVGFFTVTGSHCFFFTYFFFLVLVGPANFDPSRSFSFLL